MATIKVCDQKLRCRHFPIIYLNTTACPYIVVPIDAEQALKVLKASLLFLQTHLINETRNKVHFLFYAKKLVNARFMNFVIIECKECFVRLRHKLFRKRTYISFYLLAFLLFQVFPSSSKREAFKNLKQ